MIRTITAEALREILKNQINLDDTSRWPVDKQNRLVECMTIRCWVTSRNESLSLIDHQKALSVSLSNDARTSSISAGILSKVNIPSRRPCRCWRPTVGRWTRPHFRYSVPRPRYASDCFASETRQKFYRIPRDAQNACVEFTSSRHLANKIRISLKDMRRYSAIGRPGAERSL